MVHHLALGSQGENMAIEYLENLGITILERNWRAGRGEVDIIASRGDVLLVIEVKTRSSILGGMPEQRVDRKKFRLLQQVADAYMEQHAQWKKIRFDILSVLIPSDGSPASVFVLEDVYYWDE